jgi:hypothetical protein
MRRARLIITGVGALTALAMSPALASAAGITDDMVADFTAGTPGANTWVVEPGSVQIEPTLGLNFDGAQLPSDWAMTQWTGGTGGATVQGGAVTVDGARVTQVAAPTAMAPQTLEFRATFGSDPFQHIGLGTSFAVPEPWAMFSTGSDGTALHVRTRISDATELDTILPGALLNAPHVFRIEWSSSSVTYFVDGAEVHSDPLLVPGPLRPVISDFTAGGATLSVDWLGLLPEPASGTFESRVFDGTSAHALWNTLTPTEAKPAGTAIAYDTRTGNTPVPDATWSAYQPVGAGVAIQSPMGRYLQYRATLSSTDGTHTPSLDKVDVTYDVDETAPPASIDGVAVAGTTATVSFSSAASDVARFECSLDGGAFATCTSPQQLTGMTPGSHTVAVRAIDKAANTGAAASTQFTVQAPTTGGGGTPPPTGGGGTPGDHTAPVMTIAKRTVRVSRHGTFPVTLKCPRSEIWCKADVQIRRGGSVVASKRIKLAGGKRATLTLRLAKDARAALVDRGHVRVTAVVAVRDAAGNRATRSAKLQLLAPRR